MPVVGIVPRWFLIYRDVDEILTSANIFGIKLRIRINILKFNLRLSVEWSNSYTTRRRYSDKKRSFVYFKAEEKEKYVCIERGTNGKRLQTNFQFTWQLSCKKLSDTSITFTNWRWTSSLFLYRVFQKWDTSERNFSSNNERLLGNLRKYRSVNASKYSR